jgi:tRNA 5-methylaminomethyl-2-thiouridine biosynthesis bifunctional protein
VRIAIAVGPPRTMLPGWVPRADALLVAVRAGAPADPAVLRAAAASLVADGVAAIAADGPDASTRADATLAALSAAGLACTSVDVRGAVAAWRASRIRGRPATPAPAPGREALVVGAGLAGAAAAAALARRGWRVALADSGDAPDGAGSLQPVLAQHPSVSPDDAPLSRLTRAATLLAPAVAGAEALRPIGRIQCLDDAAAARAARGLPADWVRVVDVDEASALAGLRLRRGGLWLPRACSAEPRALIDACAIDGVHRMPAARVAVLERVADGWRALDADGATLAAAPTVLLACGAGGVAVRTRQDAGPIALDALLGPAGLHRRAGATTLARPAPEAHPRCIVGGDGHAVPIDDERVLLGPGGSPEDEAATMDEAAGDGPDARAADASLRAWRRWAAQLAAPGPIPRLSPGQAGLRLSTRDHLPVAGALADPHAIATRDGLAALPGLWIVAALGGRGLLWSTLCAELVAAALEREPSPLERPLVRQLAPDRFLLRERRRDGLTG